MKIELPTFQETKKLALKNYGDTAAVVASLLVMGYFFSLTSGIFAPFVVLQHNVTDPNNETALYTSGPLDVLFVTFAMIVSVVFYDLGKELFERLSKQKMSKDKQKSLVLRANFFFASIILLITSYYSLKHEGTLAKYTSVWAQYPFHVYQLSTKLFYLFGIAYWLQLCIIQLLFKFSPAEVNALNKKIVINVAFLLAFYLLGFAPLGTLLYFFYLSADVIVGFSAVLGSFKASKPSKAVNSHQQGATFSELAASLAKLLSGAAAVIIVAIATHVLLLALGDAPALDVASFNLNNIVVRGALLAALVAAVLVPVARA